MEEQYYGISMTNYALPSFCSGCTMYYGTMRQIEDLINGLGDNFSKTVIAFGKYKEGELKVKHPVAYNEEQLMIPYDLIRYEVLTMGPTLWEYKNIWDCTTAMRASSIRVEQILLHGENRYIRAIRPVFTNLELDAEFDTPKGRYVKIEHFWGFPGMIVAEGEQTRCALYVYQKSYDDIDQAMGDMRDPAKIDFTEVMDDVFGGG